MLARLLDPGEFGILGMAIVFTGFAQLFADFGIGSAIIQNRKLDDLVLSSSFWANTGVALLLVVSLAAASPLVAMFYNNPVLGPVVAVLSASLFFSGLTVIPRAILYKQMEFSKVAKAQVIGSFLGSLAAVSLALEGFGIWSLVAQPLLGSAVVAWLTYAYSGWKPKREFSWSSIQSLLHFSAGVIGSDLLNYANRNADNLLIGKFLGSGALGYYSLAYQLMLYPLEQVAGVIVRVLFPTLAQLQVDMVRFRQAYLKSVSAIALVTFPMMMGLYVVSNDFVLVVFGEKWLPMLPVLKILCFVGMLQSVGTTVGTIYLSTGRVRTMFNVNLIATPIILLSFVIGIKWGIVGVAVGYAIAVFILFYLTLLMALRIAKISFLAFHTALVRPFISSILMLALISLVIQEMPSLIEWSPVCRLVAEVGFGVLVYSVCMLVGNRRQIVEIFMLVKASLGKASLGKV